MKPMLLRRRGFTLIELLIVVAIIAILAAIAVPNFLEAQTRSKISRIKNDQRALATGLESYRTDSNHYPLDWGTAYLLPKYGSPKYLLDGSQYNTRFALIPLTTPVAYLSDLPGTSFNHRGSKHSNGASWEYADKGNLNRGSEYVCGDYPGRPLGPTITFFCIPEVGWSPDKRWRLRDPGPDLYMNNQENPGEYYYYRLYDPSNGTVSSGDIVRWGP